MAQLIKLESGQYLNLDQILVININEEGSFYAFFSGGYQVGLSETDLEQIDIIATFKIPFSSASLD